MTEQRQKVLVLYLADSALDSNVVGWSRYDGTGERRHMAGDETRPPYATGLDALLDGWRLIQANPLVDHVPGNEFRTGYLRFEFFFEKMVDYSPERVDSPERNNSPDQNPAGSQEASQ